MKINQERGTVMGKFRVGFEFAEFNRDLLGLVGQGF